jgi:hypothetical protein
LTWAFNSAQKPVEQQFFILPSIDSPSCRNLKRLQTIDTLILRRGFDLFSMIGLPFENYKMLIHEVDDLDASFDEHFFPKEVNQPKAMGVSLDSSHVSHDLLLLIS